MNNQVFTTRRGNASSAASWSRNRNISGGSYGAQKKKLSGISYGVIVGMLTLIVGLIYVATGTTATTYDYEIYKVEDSIAEMEAKKEDLAVEQARLTSLANANNSEVAVTMEDAEASGYVAE